MPYAAEPSLHLAPSWRARLACTECGAALEASGGGLACSSCRGFFATSEGIVNFGVKDGFYDEHGFTSAGRDFGKGPGGRLALYYARQHHLHAISRALPEGSSLVEIGCGGGSRYLARRYDVAGLEISTLSVKHAALTYGSVVQASAAKMPFASGSIDGISSSYVLEHLDDEAAPACLREMARVLRPGGRMIHCFDVANSGPFWSWATKKPWWKPLFVDAKGHHGFRPRDAWMKLFDDAGFTVKAARWYNRTWMQDLSVWGVLEDESVPGIPRRIGRLAQRIRKSTGAVSDVAVTMLTDLVDPLFPRSWASKAIVTLERRA